MFRPRSLCQMKPPLEDNQIITFHKSSLPSNYLKKIPEYTDFHKEFASKTTKPMH